MSKERELLQRCLDEFDYKGIACNELCIDINKLLAQFEQEPVATKLESHQFTAFHVSADDFKKLQKLPTGTKIYTAPPKREPLSNIDIKEASRNAKDMSFYNGVKFAEKHHGIGGGE